MYKTFFQLHETILFLKNYYFRFFSVLFEYLYIIFFQYHFATFEVVFGFNGVLFSSSSSILLTNVKILLSYLSSSNLPVTFDGFTFPFSDISFNYN